MFLMSPYTFSINRVSPTPEIRFLAVPDLPGPLRCAAAPAGHILCSLPPFCRDDIPYVVFLPCPVSCCSAADIAALLIL